MSQFKQQYDHLWTNLRGDHEAHRKAVGGDFETVGYLEFQLLRMLGLRPESFVIDVGCGSGRLASQLAPWLTGPYLGTDIMGSLLDYARTLCSRDDWTFVETDGFEIPANDGCADFIVFFSVFTHLTHEDTWKYIQEARRVLKPGGKLVCSFLEFAVDSHWTIFENDANDAAPDKILNQFLSRDALAAFARNAGLRVESFLDGDKANIPIDRELTWQSGARASESGSLGQSTCVLVKPAAP